MKITVNANDFCPDDCKMCEIEQETTRFYDYLYVSRIRAFIETKRR